MLNIRENCFETNSSSTHSMVIVEDSKLEKWKNGELFYIISEDDFVSKYGKERRMEEIYANALYSNLYAYQDEIIDAIKEHRIEDYIKSMIDSENWYIDINYLPLSFDQWMENENDYLEHDEHTYKMKDGEDLHIFCSYGYDG